MKVLVVNDDRIQAAILKRLLLADHEVEAAYDTERAWQKIADWEPDVLVVDWLMPKLAGVELTKRIRSTPSHKHLYV